MSFGAAFLLLASSPYVFSSPIPPNQQPYLAWRGEPNTRGTWTLLSNCVITLTLCVYTAVHLNVPGKDATGTQKYLCRAKWVMIGLFAPELVVYTAWRQWSSAKQLTKEMQRLCNSAKKPSHAKLASWTMTHSFFAEMGGYSIDLDQQGGPKYSPDERVTLTPEGVLHIAKLGYELPSITKAQIKDRSKADIIAKTLACVQAGYMILQEMSRLIFHLPITMLEVNTIGHVFCALLMFMFWLEKPLGVEEPLPVTGEWVKESSAWWIMRLYWTPRRFGSFRPPKDLIKWNERDAFDEFCRRIVIVREPGDRSGDSPTRADLEQPTLRSIPITNGVPISYKNWKSNDVILVVAEADLSQTAEQFRTEIMSYGMWSMLVTEVYRTEKVLHDCRPLLAGHGWQKPLEIYLTPDGLARWDVAWRMWRPSPEYLSKKHYISRRAENWFSGSGHLSLVSEDYAVGAVALFTALYGGLHALLWHSHFPTSIERWLWRCSACIIAGSGFVTTSLTLIRNNEWTLFKKIRKMIRTTVNFFERCLDFLFGLLHIHFIDGDYVTRACLFLLVVAISLCYFASRAFLVIEAFISLRSLPAEAYIIPAWTQWLPHL